MHIVFTGPEGAPFVGKEIDVIHLGEASLEDLAALQRGTKLNLKTIMGRIMATEEAQRAAAAAEEAGLDPSTVFPSHDDDDEGDPYNDLAADAAGADELFNMQVTLFLALRTAGYRIHWRVARDMKFGDFDFVADVEDETDDEATVEASNGPEGQPADPQPSTSPSLPAAPDVDMPTPKAVSPVSPL